LINFDTFLIVQITLLIRQMALDLLIFDLMYN